MSKNNLTKQELVMFDNVLENFEEALVYTEASSTFQVDSVSLGRANKTVWREQPVMVDSHEGLDQTGNFDGHTEMAVPVVVDRVRSVNGSMGGDELDSQRFLKRIGDSAKVKLASDVNDALRRQASYYGSIVDTSSSKAQGFDDVARMMVLFDEQGVPVNERQAFYSSRDFVGMAGDLASRQTLQGKTQTAYEKAYINDIANFSVHTDPSALMLPASLVTNATVDGADQRHKPTATRKDPVTDDEHNIDNRSMILKVSAAQFKVGDAFTIAGVYALHHINKSVTEELKTFRVVGVNSASEIVITPSIVADDYTDPSGAERAYKNVSATPANGAAISMLNNKKAYVNTFFCKDALEILPSKLSIDKKDGWLTTQASLSNGLTLYYTRQGDINDLGMKYRFNIAFGTAMRNPEMAGVQLFNQS